MPRMYTIYLNEDEREVVIDALRGHSYGRRSAAESSSEHVVLQREATIASELANRIWVSDGAPT